MKKLTTVLIVMAFACLLALPKPAEAGVQFGLKLGANMAKPTGADAAELAETLKTKVGFAGGIFLAFNFGKVITIQTEVLYTMKGAAYEYTDIDETVQGKLYGDYIEIPLLLKLKIPTPGIQPFIEAGPYVGFKLREKVTEAGADVTPTEAILKNNDYGAIFGGGVHLGRSFHVGVRYSLGLQKVIDLGLIESIDVKNGVWSATLGFGF